MDKKTISIVSYVTIIGWIISYFVSKDQQPKSSLVTYHLKQGLGLFIVALLFNIALTIVITIVPALYLIGYVGYAFLALIIIGIINASNEQEKPLPVIGKMFENKFSFLN